MDFMAELSRLINLPADTILQYRYTVFGGRAVYVAGIRVSGLLAQMLWN
jgi:hypothetical protein